MHTRQVRVGREGILEKAEALFTERGYRAVSIREIAQACQVTNAALYYHFPNKEALFQEVMEQHAASLRERMLKAGQPAESAQEKVAAMLLEYARIAAGQRSPFFLIRRDPDFNDGSQFRERFVAIVHAMLQPLDETLHQAMDAGTLRSLPSGVSPAALLVGMLHGMVQHQHTCLGKNLNEQDVRLVVNIFWQGMRNS